MRVFFVLIILFVFTFPAHGKQITQTTTGWCSPTIANVVGDVYVKCIGVSPKAHKKLNVELNKVRIKSNLKIDQLIVEAENWARRYHDIKQNLGRLVASPGEIKEINQLIVDGEFGIAAARLDKKIAQQQKQLGNLAEMLYLRASVYLLEFDEINAIKQIRLAYQYQPENSKYLLAYVSSLISEGKLKTAEKVLTAAIPLLGNSLKDGSVEDAISFANALDKLGVIYVLTGNSSRLKELTEETIDVIRYLENSQLAQNDSLELLELTSILSFSLGRNNLSSGNLDVAEKLFGVSINLYLKLCEKKSGNFCSNAALATSFTGLTDYMRANYPRAILRYELAHDMLNSAGVTNLVENEIKARILFGKAEAYHELGKQREAAENWMGTINTWDGGKYISLERREFIAHSYIGLGEYEFGKKNLAQGEVYIKKALLLAENSESDAIEFEKALALVNLGHLYGALSKGTLAHQYASQASDIIYEYWKKEPNEYKSYYARSLMVLGYSFHLINDFAEGCKWLLQAHDIDPGGTWNKSVLEQINLAGC